MSSQITFKFYGQDKICENGYQTICWYLFLVDGVYKNLNTLVDDFIHTINFKEDALPFFVKKNLGNTESFLKHAFNEEILSIENFKVFNKHELINFFDKYLADDDWGSDRGEFERILKKFYTSITKENSDTFFLISKEWFDKESNIFNPFAYIYIYYFLIIWFDSDKKLLNVCEWFYD